MLWLIILAQLFRKLIYQRYLEKHMLNMQNAIGGFKSCGIEPFNSQIFQYHYFAASATIDGPLVIENNINNDSSLTPNTIDYATICQPGPSTTDGLEVILPPTIS